MQCAKNLLMNGFIKNNKMFEHGYGNSTIERINNGFIYIGGTMIGDYLIMETTKCNNIYTTTNHFTKLKPAKKLNYVLTFYDLTFHNDEIEPHVSNLGVSFKVCNINIK